ncbi:hemerythrin domain-containing protein [Calditrichota bacterium]
MAQKKSKIADMVLDEHKIIRDCLNSLSKQVTKKIKEKDFAEWRLEFIWECRDFRNHMLKHFDFEELDGFMKEVMEDAPEVVNVVKKLESEHSSLIEKLDKIIDDFQKMEVKEGEKLVEIQQRLKRLIISIKAHEKAENDLIQRVYSQEYGYPAQ